MGRGFVVISLRVRRDATALCRTSVGAHWGACDVGGRGRGPGPVRSTRRAATRAGSLRARTRSDRRPARATGTRVRERTPRSRSARRTRAQAPRPCASRPPSPRPRRRDGTSTAAGPDQVRGHHVLPWPGSRAWSAPNPNARSRATSMNGPVRPTRPAKAPPVTSAATRSVRRVRKPSGHRSSDAGLEGDGRPVDVQRARQEVLRVGQECVRHAALRDRRVDDRRAVGAGRGHLAPADPVAEVGIGEHELTFRTGAVPRTSPPAGGCRALPARAAHATTPRRRRAAPPARPP